jgi:hypothetical protein
MTKSQTYNTAIALCLLHAAFVSFSAWVPIGPNTDSFNKVFLFGIWPILVLVWPIWLIVIFVLWFFGQRNWLRLLVPVFVGIVFLIPALFYVLVMYAFFTRGPG